MGKYIPVEPEKWAAMVKAQSDLVRYKEMCDELDAECTRLKDENARLRSFCTRTIIPNIDLEKEITRLKAEVERLTERNQFLEQVDSYLQSANLYAEEQRSMELEAQVERLTKAGDAMAADVLFVFGENKDVDAWNAAKEGKQP